MISKPKPSTSCWVAAVRTTTAIYPEHPPFHPSQAYPEYPFSGQIASQPNSAYEGVRNLLRELGGDAEHYGAPVWNPLGDIIEPGMRVVIKPNFVLSRHPKGKDLFSVITHGSVLRAVADYCWIALRGRGSIIFADAPQYDCNAEDLPLLTGLPVVAEFLRRSGVDSRFCDLREYWSKGKHFDSMRQSLPGDPLGSVLVDLGKTSALADKDHIQQLYGAVYHREETIRHHSGGRHEYQVSRTMLEADVFISVPKLKVHKKVGVTLNAKGLVGIATNKNYLVHYTLKPPREGGDQYPDQLFSPVEETLIRAERWMYDHFLASKSRWLESLHRSIYWLHNHSTKRLGLRVAEHKRTMDAGNWHGNDSAWRMTADLMRIMHFADASGRMHTTPQRRFFSIIDGIIGGEGNGPLSPDPKPSSVLIGGRNLLATDLVATRLMGFDPLKLKLYRELLGNPHFDLGLRALEEIAVRSPEPGWSGCLADAHDAFLGFRPHPGWVDKVEIGLCT